LYKRNRNSTTVLHKYLPQWKGLEQQRESLKVAQSQGYQMARFFLPASALASRKEIRCPERHTDLESTSFQYRTSNHVSH